MDAKMGMFFTSLMKGKAAKAQQERDAEVRAGENKLKDQLIKLQIQNAKIKQIQDAQKAKDEDMLRPYKQKLFEKAFGAQDQQPTGGQQFSDSFNQQPGVTDQIAAGQMSPEMLAIMSKEIGYDFLGAGRLQQQKEISERNYNLREKNYKAIDEDRDRAYNRGFSETKEITVTNPDGSQSVMRLPKFNGAGNNIQTKPSRGDLRIEEGNLPMWIDPKTLESAPYGFTPNKAKEAGYIRISANDKSRLNDFRGVGALATTLEELAKKVFPEKGGFKDKVVGGTKRTIGAALETDPDARLLQDTINGTLAAFVRMYEKGTLTDKDIARARNLHIRLTNSADVVWMKINAIKKLIDDSQSSFLGVPPPKKDKYDVGEIYTGENGEKALYLGDDKWEVQ